MKAVVLLSFVAALAGCSTLNDHGIGGPPRLACVAAGAAIDDRVAGSDDMHLSLVRRFADGDALCQARSTAAPAAVDSQAMAAAAALQSRSDQAAHAPRRSSEGRLDH